MYRIVFVVVWFDFVWVDVPYVNTNMPHLDIYKTVSMAYEHTMVRSVRLKDGPINAIERSRGSTINQSSVRCGQQCKRT